jgi:hypothetical protein
LLKIQEKGVWENILKMERGQVIILSMPRPGYDSRIFYAFFFKP